LTASPPPTTIYVFDTSSIIEFKASVVPAANQWNVFKALEEMVARGEIAVCKQVFSELTRITHTDVAGAWAHGVKPQCRYLEVEHDWVVQVLDVVPDLLDFDKQNEDADPWVVAQACELREAGYQAFIVTCDQRDHPGNLSIVSACNRLQLVALEPEEFLIRVGLTELAGIE
jgi:Domain of unknown function (DUF4411)